MSEMAHFFVVISGSKIHERVAHFFIDIYILPPEERTESLIFTMQKINFILRMVT